MNNIFNTFCGKLPNNINEVLPINEKKMVTFLNPFSIYMASEHDDCYKNFDTIASDGTVPLILLNIFYPKLKTQRFSFDMTSVAKELFLHCVENKLSIYFLGSKQKEIEEFIVLIQNEFPGLQIVGYNNGYIYGDEEKVFKSIIDLDPDVLVVGMGTPMQDINAVKIKQKGFKGSIYTCGGFFHQTTKNINYYPNWINKFNLRGFYRMYKEPYVIKRVLIYYPRFVLYFSKYLLSVRKQT